jgi:hypothetical protein
MPENTAPQDSSPKWEEITPTLIELIHSDNDEAAAAAMKDLRRMSQMADRLGDMVPALQRLHAAATTAITEYDNDIDGVISGASAVELQCALEQANQALSGKSQDELDAEQSRIIRP